MKNITIQLADGKNLEIREKGFDKMKSSELKIAASTLSHYSDELEKEMRNRNIEKSSDSLQIELEKVTRPIRRLQLLAVLPLIIFCATFYLILISTKIERFAIFSSIFYLLIAGIGCIALTFGFIYASGKREKERIERELKHISEDQSQKPISNAHI